MVGYLVIEDEQSVTSVHQDLMTPLSQPSRESMTALSENLLQALDLDHV
jgi:heptaprenylglyceryl phosphate synthase